MKLEGTAIIQSGTHSSAILSYKANKDSMFIDTNDNSIQLLPTGPHGQYRGKYIADNKTYYIGIAISDDQSIRAIVVSNGEIIHRDIHEPTKLESSVLMYENIVGRSYLFVP